MNFRRNNQLLYRESVKKWMILFLLSFISFSFTDLNAQKKAKCPVLGPKLTAEEYCKKYGDEARRQMKKYGIPASITLAQGMHETAFGSSYLAIEAKNHFGIKAYRADWKGPVVRCDDDAKDEPFCKFNTVEESYEYHSKFLQGTRYKPLFELDIRDYEGWAHGLRKCGYATDPKYGNILISLVEKYNLDAYDVADAKTLGETHKLYTTKQKGGLYYVRCYADDDLSVIAKEFGLSVRKLRSWNDMTKKSVLKEGDIVYLQKKNKKADKGHEVHVVRGGESLWSISQLYGVQVLKLMKRNKLVSATVQAGQELRLR